MVSVPTHHPHKGLPYTFTCIPTPTALKLRLLGIVHLPRKHRNVAVGAFINRIQRKAYSRSFSARQSVSFALPSMIYRAMSVCFKLCILRGLHTFICHIRRCRAYLSSQTSRVSENRDYVVLCCYIHPCLICGHCFLCTPASNHFTAPNLLATSTFDNSRCSGSCCFSETTNTLGM